MVVWAFLFAQKYLMLVLNRKIALDFVQNYWTFDMAIYLIIAGLIEGVAFAFLIFYFLKTRFEHKQLALNRERFLVEQKIIALRIKNNQNRVIEWNDRLKKYNKELIGKADNIQNAEVHLREEKLSLEKEKARIKRLIQEIQLKQQELVNQELELSKTADALEAKEKHINDKERALKEQESKVEQKKNDLEIEWQRFLLKKDALDSERKLIENEKAEFINIRQQFALEQQKQIEQKNEIEMKTNDLEKKEKRFEEKERELKKRGRELDEEQKKLIKERADFEKSNKSRRPPHRRESDGCQKPETAPKKPRIIPELVCRKKGGCWYLGIQVSKNISEDYQIQVFQNEKELTQNEVNENCWKLSTLSPLTIKWQNVNDRGEKVLSISEDEDCFPLLFKLIGKSERYGKFANNPSCGGYCAVVPTDWKRDDESSGSAPIESENFFISGYKVHFFYLRRNSGFSIAFIKPSGERVDRYPKAFRFSLSGNQIPDANDEIGLLFGDELPKIVDNLSWNGIETIVIGEEGEGIGELRWEIRPDPNFQELDLNQIEKQGNISISKSKRSWFFIRFYDTSEKLVESLDFRYIQGLKKINISNHSIIPLRDGHRAVDIRFCHDESCVITIDKGKNEKILVKKDQQGTVAIIPPDPAWDMTDWEIKDGNGKRVNLELLVERIWWNLANEEDILVSNDWSDKPIDIPKDYFLPTSHHTISLQLPKIGLIKKVFVGIDEHNKKEYRVNPTQRSIRIPLREFCDDVTISKSNSREKLSVWIDTDGEITNFIIAKIVTEFYPEDEREPEPDGRNEIPCCENCDHARIRFNVTWCRRSNWPQQKYIENFKENFAHYKCGEWRGEYQNKDGIWISN